jgi:Ca2+/H+ antiporter
MLFMRALDIDCHFENPSEHVITDTEYNISPPTTTTSTRTIKIAISTSLLSATMKLTLYLLPLSFHLFAHAKDCSKDPRCISSTLKTTITTSKTSTISTESSTPSLTVATETICYLGSVSYTTFEKTTTEQVCTPSSWVTLTSSAVYGDSSCFPTAVTRRIG